MQVNAKQLPRGFCDIKSLKPTFFLWFDSVSFPWENSLSPSYSPQISAGFIFPLAAFCPSTGLRPCPTRRLPGGTVSLAERNLSISSEQTPSRDTGNHAQKTIFFFFPKIYHMQMAVPGVCEPKSLREDLPSFKFLFEGMRWSGYFKLNRPQCKQHCYSNRDYTKSVPLAHSCSQKYQRDVQPLASVWARAARLLCSGLHKEDSASTQCSVSRRNT